MRLSDWSSELCSSDLSCLLPLLALQQQAWQQITFQRKLRFLLACLVCRQLRLEERRLRNCYLAGRKPPDPSGTRSMITELSEGIFSPRCCWGLARNSRASFRFLHQARMNCLRSEEHTSEFQSLMLSSYAVFCLKKTK